MVFDIGPHRTVGDEKVLDIGANPIINTDADPTGSPTTSPTTLSIITHRKSCGKDAPGHLCGDF
jgi:hypothetical protein